MLKDQLQKKTAKSDVLDKGLLDIPTRIVCAIIGYYSALFAFGWGVSSLGGIFGGSMRGLIFGLIGLVFTLIATGVATLTIRRAMGLRPIPSWQGAEPDAEPAPPILMAGKVKMASKEVIKAEPWRVLGWLAVSALLAGGSGSVLLSARGWQNQVMPGLLLITGLAMAAPALRLLLTGYVGFTYDAQGVTIPGLLGEKKFAWRDIKAIKIYDRTFYVYHVIPVRKVSYLYLEVPGGLFGNRKVYLPTQFTSLSNDETQSLRALMDQQRMLNQGVPQSTNPSTTSKPSTTRAPYVAAKPTVQRGSRWF
jgi:hypothetical protein